MAALKLDLTLLFKSFIRDRRGNVTSMQVKTDSEADVATIYCKLDQDCTKLPEATQTALKARFLQLATQHAEQAGKFKYVDSNSVYLSKNGIGVNLLDAPRTILATETFELP